MTAINLYLDRQGAAAKFRDLTGAYAKIANGLPLDGMEREIALQAIADRASDQTPGDDGTGWARWDDLQHAHGDKYNDLEQPEYNEWIETWRRENPAPPPLAAGERKPSTYVPPQVVIHVAPPVQADTLRCVFTERGLIILGPASALPRATGAPVEKED